MLRDTIADLIMIIIIRMQTGDVAPRSKITLCVLNRDDPIKGEFAHAVFISEVAGSVRFQGRV